jgi:hypothetical protein
MHQKEKEQNIWKEGEVERSCLYYHGKVIANFSSVGFQAGSEVHVNKIVF